MTFWYSNLNGLRLIQTLKLQNMKVYSRRKPELPYMFKKNGFIVYDILSK